MYNCASAAASPTTATSTKASDPTEDRCLSHSLVSPQVQQMRACGQIPEGSARSQEQRMLTVGARDDFVAHDQPSHANARTRDVAAGAAW